MKAVEGIEMMKAWKIAPVVLAASVFLTACGDRGTDTTAAQTEGSAVQTEAEATTAPAASADAPAEAESLEEKSKTLVMKVVSGDFAGVVAEFNDELKDTLSEENFRAGWEQMTVSAGQFQDYYKTEAEESDKIYHCILQCEDSGIRLSFSYDEEGKVKSVWTDLFAIPPELTENETLKEQEIQIPFTSNGTEYQLSGVLTLPAGVEKPPVVILVQGSGQSDYNESIKGNKPFQDLAFGLAEKGIASIRYNKRYYQFPGQAPGALTISDEVLDDAATAIQMAAGLDSVDGSRIYLIGHSLGGMLAPKIAQDNPQLIGLISLAGTPRNLADVVYDQNVDALDQMADVNELQKQASLAQLKQMVEQAKSVSDLTDQTNLIGLPTCYWASLNQIDTVSIVKELKIPMLFLQGTADFQVKPDTDFAAWKEALDGHENAQFQTYEDLNHLFMKTNGKTDVSEYDVPGHVEQAVIDDIAAFILENAAE